MIEYFLEPYGQISRISYFLGSIGLMVALAFSWVLLSVLSSGLTDPILIYPMLTATLILSLGGWWSSMMLVIKRGNDLGLPWWTSVVLMHLPFANTFFYLYLLFVPGSRAR